MNKILTVLVLFFFGVSAPLFAQNLTIEMDKDTISMEETVMVKYIINDACDASELEFDQFLVVSGPSVSRSISIVNGKRTAESSYTVLLTPIKEGTFQLPSSLCDIQLENPINLVVKRGHESQERKDERIRKTRKLKKI